MRIKVLPSVNANLIQLHNHCVVSSESELLLVTRSNDNHSPGPVMREVSPSSYQRSELSNRVFCSFSSRKESICELIPISNSLGEETALVNVSISKGGLKCQRVMISDMPNWEDKVIRRYTGCTLQTFVKHYDSTISPPFFQRFPL